MNTAPPFQPQICPAAPYNSLINPNFATYAQLSPNFPLNTGSNHSQVVSNTGNNTYFNHINAQNAAIKASGSTQPYVMFKTQQERMMYIQGQMAAQTRKMAMVTGAQVGNPAANPVPTANQVCDNVFSIINGE
jgi:hypothetical protein